MIICDNNAFIIDDKARQVTEPFVAYYYRQNFEKILEWRAWRKLWHFHGLPIIHNRVVEIFTTADDNFST